MNPEGFPTVLEILGRWTVLHAELSQGSRRRPVLGGPFGASGFEMSSLLYAENGLWTVFYSVFHVDSGLTLSLSRTKHDALSEARFALIEFDPIQLQEALRRARAALAARQEAIRERHAESRREWHAANPSPPIVKSIPKRRREIFEKSDGKCHYCGAVLALDGRWHIEHKMPRALLGGSETGNLVAACVPCNMKKKDRTDLEFIEAQKGHAA